MRYEKRAYLLVDHLKELRAGALGELQASTVTAFQRSAQQNLLSVQNIGNQGQMRTKDTHKKDFKKTTNFENTY